MTARIGVTVFRPVKLAATVSRDVPMPTAVSASMIGIDIATAVPSTSSSTMIAAPRPIMSLEPDSGATPLGTSPPYSTVRPEPPTALLTSFSSWFRSAFSTSDALLSNLTSKKPILPSWLIAPGSPAQASPTEPTCGTFAAAFSALVIAAFAESLSTPLSDVKVTIAESPAFAGNRALSRSLACCVSDPGIVNSFTSRPPKMVLEPTARTSRPIQTAIVRFGCDAHARANRASAPLLLDFMGAPWLVSTKKHDVAARAMSRQRLRQSLAGRSPGCNARASRRSMSGRLSETRGTNEVRDRPARDQHPPHARDRRGAGGELRSSRHADGDGAGGLHALAGVHALRPRGPDLAEPGPVRPQRRPCVDAALQLAPPRAGQGREPHLRDARRVEHAARRSEAIPPARLARAWPSRVPLDVRRRDHDRPAQQRLRHLSRHGDRRQVAGRPLQPPRVRALRLRHLRPRRGRLHDGGHLGRGRLASGSSEALEPLLDLRQQPHFDRGQHGSRLHRRRRHALHRVRLERHPRR